MVRLLTQYGADVNLGVMAPTTRGEIYRSPLNRARSQAIRSFLIERGAGG